MDRGGLVTAVAWLTVVGLVLNGGVAAWQIGRWVRGRAAREEARDAEMLERLREQMTPQPGDKELLERVLDRLLEAVVPEPQPLSEKAADPTFSDAEYELPDPDVGDWTDPFIGLERPVVARLEPGQAIPGLAREDIAESESVGAEEWQNIGAGSFEEWARDTMVPEGVAEDESAARWVEPIDFEEPV